LHAPCAQLQTIAHTKLLNLLPSFPACLPACPLPAGSSAPPGPTPRGAPTAWPPPSPRSSWTTTRPPLKLRGWPTASSYRSDAGVEGACLKWRRLQGRRGCAEGAWPDPWWLLLPWRVPICKPLLCFIDVDFSTASCVNLRCTDSKSQGAQRVGMQAPRQLPPAGRAAAPIAAALHAWRDLSHPT
jgi:hypothetical protein